MPILYWFISFASLVIPLITTLTLLILLWDSLKTAAPYIPLPKEVLPKIINALEIKDNSVVYDLGCGDGRVLKACYNSNPKAVCIGIEKGIVPFCLAKLRLKKFQKSVKIIYQDFFKRKFSDATHVFTYLFPKPMNLLWPKFQRELKSGARLVSCDFPIDQKQPIKIVDLGRPGKRANKLYIYEF